MSVIPLRKRTKQANSFQPEEMQNSDFFSQQPDIDKTTTLLYTVQYSRHRKSICRSPSCVSSPSFATNFLILHLFRNSSRIHAQPYTGDRARTLSLLNRFSSLSDCLLGSAERERERGEGGRAGGWRRGREKLPSLPPSPIGVYNVAYVVCSKR